MMRLVKRALRLTATDWLLLARAVVALAATRVALWVAGVRGARRAARTVAALAGRANPERLPWAVAVAGRAVPAATCLVQAIALQALLARAGRQCRVEIGVARGQAFEAHAWVVAQDQVVLGAFEAARFERITVLD